ncbi:hypothetical protein KKE26_06150, partial [bacterium]|nr:hypothetical protein [bacterium]
MMKNRLCVMIFLLFLPLAAFGKANDPPTIPLGKVSTVWKGIGNLPFWTRSVFSINDTYSVKLSEETTIFRLGLIWQTMNQTMSPKRGTLITRVEKETCPDSGEWGLLFEAINEVISKKGSDEDIVVTRDICQEEPEARYRITMQTLMPFGQKTKPKTTCLTVCLTSKAYTIYTSVSLIPLFTPHNLGENGSYTRLLSAADLAGLSGMGIEDARVRIEGQEALGFDLSNARIEINPVTEDTLRIDYFPAKQGTTSNLLPENLCLRDADPGDSYVLLKDLPLRLKFITTFTSDKKEIKTLAIRVVGPKEARLFSPSPDRGLELILLPAVVWQPYAQTSPIIGSVTSIAGIEEMQEEATKETPAVEEAQHEQLYEQPCEQEKEVVEEQAEEAEVVKEATPPISLAVIDKQEEQEEKSEQTFNLLTNGDFSSGLE